MGELMTPNMLSYSVSKLDHSLPGSLAGHTWAQSVISWTVLVNGENLCGFTSSKCTYLLQKKQLHVVVN